MIIIIYSPWKITASTYKHLFLQIQLIHFIISSIDELITRSIERLPRPISSESVERDKSQRYRYRKQKLGDERQALI